MSRRKIETLSYKLRPAESLHRSGVNSLAISAGGLYSAGRDGVVRYWDTAAEQPQQISALDGHTDWVNAVILAGKDAVISASSDTTIVVWGSAARGHGRMATLRCHTDYVKALAYSEAAQTLVSSSLDQSILLWDLATAVPLRRQHRSGEADGDSPTLMDGPSESAYSIAMDYAGLLVASGSTENNVHVWDTRAEQHAFTLHGHTDHVRSVLLNREGSVCVSGGSDVSA